MSSCVYDNGFQDVDNMDSLNVDSVTNVIIEMDVLLNLLPEAETPIRYRFYHINMKNEIEINGIYFGLYTEFSVEKIKDHPLFNSFSPYGKSCFCSGIAYLFENNITGAGPDITNWNNKYYYKCYSGDDMGMLRKLIHVYDSTDTVSDIYRSIYVPVDVKGSLLLMKEGDTYRLDYKSPDYSKEHIPWDYIDSVARTRGWLKPGVKISRTQY